MAAAAPLRTFRFVLNNKVVSKVQREDLALGFQRFGSDKNANCAPQTDTKSKTADGETNCASNRYAITNPTAQDFGIFFPG